MKLSLALPALLSFFFHSFTVCDTVIAIGGHGETTGFVLGLSQLC